MSWDIGKRGPDWSSTPKTLSAGEKIAKIGPANPEIIVLRTIIKKYKRKKISKKLMQAKYKTGCFPSGLNYAIGPIGLVRWRGMWSGQRWNCYHQHWSHRHGCWWIPTGIRCGSIWKVGGPVDGGGDGKGVSIPSQPTRGLGEHCKLPQRGLGQSLGRNWILYYLNAKEAIWWDASHTEYKLMKL